MVFTAAKLSRPATSERDVGGIMQLSRHIYTTLSGTQASIFVQHEQRMNTTQKMAVCFPDMTGHAMSFTLMRKAELRCVCTVCSCLPPRVTIELTCGSNLTNLCPGMIRLTM